jgi:hypothetical protein
MGVCSAFRRHTKAHATPGAVARSFLMPAPCRRSCPNSAGRTRARCVFNASGASLRPLDVLLRRMSDIGCCAERGDGRCNKLARAILRDIERRRQRLYARVSAESRSRRRSRFAASVGEAAARDFSAAGCRWAERRCLIRRRLSAAGDLGLMRANAACTACCCNSATATRRSSSSNLNTSYSTLQK